MKHPLKFFSKQRDEETRYEYLKGMGQDLARHWCPDPFKQRCQDDQKSEQENGLKHKCHNEADKAPSGMPQGGREESVKRPQVTNVPAFGTPRRV